MVGIKNTAICFCELFCKTYEVSIAAKGKIRTDFSIDFLKKDFFHATGETTVFYDRLSKQEK